MKNAEELVNAAPSLVQALDADALSLVTKSVEATLLHGKKWEFTKHSERMRPRRVWADNDDTILETSTDSVTLWLRADGGAQLLKTANWTSYDGKTKSDPQFGGGGSTETIGCTRLLREKKRSKLETTDAFITNPTRDMKGYGSWWIEKKEGDDGEGVLRIKGDGRFAGGAVEDDDLLYNGSGPKEDITFAVSIAKLRADFKHTNLKE